MFEGGVGLAAVAVSGEEEVVGNDVGGDAGLGDEAVEGKEVGVFGLAELGGEDGVGGEDGGAAVGVDGVAGEEGGLLEVVLADEAEDAVVEVKASAREGGDRFGDLRGVRVLGGGRRLLTLGLVGLGVTEGVERGLDALAALAAAEIG